MISYTPTVELCPGSNRDAAAQVLLACGVTDDVVNRVLAHFESTNKQSQDDFKEIFIRPTWVLERQWKHDVPGCERYLCRSGADLPDILKKFGFREDVLGCINVAARISPSRTATGYGRDVASRWLCVNCPNNLRDVVFGKV